MSKEQKPIVTTPEASDQVSGPSIGLLITGILGAALSFIGLIASLFETGIESIKAHEFMGGYASIAEGAAGVAFCFCGPPGSWFYHLCLSEDERTHPMEFMYCRQHNCHDSLYQPLLHRGLADRNLVPCCLDKTRG